MARMKMDYKSTWKNLQWLSLRSHFGNVLPDLNFLLWPVGHNNKRHYHTSHREKLPKCQNKAFFVFNSINESFPSNSLKEQRISSVTRYCHGALPTLRTISYLYYIQSFTGSQRVQCSHAGATLYMMLAKIMGLGLHGLCQRKIGNFFYHLLTLK